MPAGRSSFSSFLLFRIVGACLALLLPVFAASGAGAQTVPPAAKPTAEHLFRLLPVDIFDNTDEGFREADKDILFAKGYTSAWAVAHNDADTLIIAALDAVRTEVILHAFRNVSGGMAVLNARTPESCACEFWRWEENGGLVPESPPLDPLIADFFAPGHPLPADLQAEFFFCLTETYSELEALPRFWNADGPVYLAPSMRVRYAWGGAGFVKRVTPLR